MEFYYYYYYYYYYHGCVGLSETVAPKSQWLLIVMFNE